MLYCCTKRKTTHPPPTAALGWIFEPTSSRNKMGAAVGGVGRGEEGRRRAQTKMMLEVIVIARTRIYRGDILERRPLILIALSVLFALSPCIKKNDLESRGCVYLAWYHSGREYSTILCSNINIKRSSCYRSEWRTAWKKKTLCLYY